MNEKLYIIIPAYNEEENIRQVIDEWYPVVAAHDGNGASRLVILDDGSKDSTWSIMQACARTRPLFLPMTKPNGGHGATVLYGYQYALAQGADYIFQTDSDRQTLPAEFGPFWEQRERFDMIIGWRKSRQDGLSRILVAKILKLVIRLCFGVTVTDANTPYRLMKAGTLSEYIGLIPENFDLSNAILSVIYAKKKLKVKYIPITFRPRQGDVNSLDLKRIFEIGVQALKDFWLLNKTL